MTQPFRKAADLTKGELKDAVRYLVEADDGRMRGWALAAAAAERLGANFYDAASMGHPGVSVSFEAQSTFSARVRRAADELVAEGRLRKVPRAGVHPDGSVTFGNETWYYTAARWDRDVARAKLAAAEKAGEAERWHAVNERIWKGAGVVTSLPADPPGLEDWETITGKAGW